MRIHTLVLPLAVSGIVAAAAHPAGAQNTVPAELVRALMGSPAPGAPPAEIVVGRLPDVIPAGVAPAGGRVLGGVVHDTTSAIVAFAVPQAPAEALAALRQALTQGGWTSPEPRGQRGFVDNRAMNWGFLCRGSEVLTTSAAPASGGGAYVRVEYSRAHRASLCSMQQMNARAGQRAPWEDVPIPVLSSPPGATQVSVGSGMIPGGYGGSGASTYARLRVDRPVAELVQHYAAQLQAAGWTPSPPVASPAFAGQAFRMRGADGKEWFGVLTAIAIPDSQVRDLTFQVSALPPEDRPF